ncbi:MAG TPA: ATP-binding protein [Burkholderiales bacterium]|nr:ATP-binding protein [Burkholderiales bacterium]
MRRYYPRSFLKLLVIGFTLVALPLILALINSAVSVDQLASRSQQTVYQAVQATQSTRRLAELITTMERAARQMVILGDRSLIDAYGVAREQLTRTAQQFERLPFDVEQKSALDRILRGEEEIYKALSDPSAQTSELAKTVQRFVDLAAEARIINMRSNALIEREVDEMRATAEQARRIMFWQLLALLPVVLFLVIGFSILIARPIRRIDEAIRRLGGGQFAVPVIVSGPQDLEQLGERLEWMRRELLDLERQKNQFLRQVSHELKTPLTALREGAELLSEEVVGKLTPGQREITEIMRHNSVELQKLIEALLSFGASQFRKVAVDLEPVEIRQVVERVVADHSLAIRSRGLTVDLSVPDVMISADSEKLRVVLDNLVSNAVKFSPAGGVIQIAGRADAEVIQLEVIDQGPGIAPADRDRIFEPFFQGRNEGAGPVRGTGIGLSVVKEYVFGHGGSIEVVDSQKGAHLRVRLPLAGVGAKAAAI